MEVNLEWLVSEGYSHWHTSVCRRTQVWPCYLCMHFVSRACKELVSKKPQLPAGNNTGHALRVFNICLAFPFVCLKLKVFLLYFWKLILNTTNPLIRSVSHVLYWTNGGDYCCGQSALCSFLQPFPCLHPHLHVAHGRKQVLWESFSHWDPQGLVSALIQDAWEMSSSGKLPYMDQTPNLATSWSWIS